MASWATGNLARSQQAMEAIDRGVQAKQRGLGQLGGALGRVGELGFTGWQNQLGRQQELEKQRREIEAKKELEKMLQLFEAHSYGGVNMTPERVPPGPGAPMLPKELQGEGYQAEVPEATEKYSPAQQMLKDIGIQGGWKQSALLEQQPDQAILRAARELYPDYDQLQPAEQNRIFRLLKFGYDAYFQRSGGDTGAGDALAEALKWVRAQTFDFANNVEKGMAYSRYDETSEQYIYSGEKSDSIDVLMEELWNRAKLSPKILNMFPTREQFDRELRPLITNWIMEGGNNQTTNMPEEKKLSELSGVDLTNELLRYKKYLTGSDLEKANSIIKERNLGSTSPLTIIGEILTRALIIKAMRNKSSSEEKVSSGKSQKEYIESNKYMKEYMNQYK